MADQSSFFPSQRLFESRTCVSRVYVLSSREVDEDSCVPRRILISEVEAEAQPDEFSRRSSDGNYRHLTVHGFARPGNGNREGVNSSHPCSRFQDGSLRMQKCRVSYNRSWGRHEILNLGIPLGSRFSLSIPFVLPNLIPRILFVFLLDFLISWQLSLNKTSLAEASVYLGIRGALISLAPN